MKSEEYRAIRNHTNLNQGQLAELLGVTLNTVSRRELGQLPISTEAELAIRYLMFTFLDQMPAKEIDTIVLNQVMSLPIPKGRKRKRDEEHVSKFSKPGLAHSELVARLVADYGFECQNMTRNANGPFIQRAKYGDRVFIGVSNKIQEVAMCSVALQAANFARQYLL